MRQLLLFETPTHLEPDCFLSGSPAVPDPVEETYLPWNWRERPVAQAEVIPLFTGYLAICEPQEAA